MLEKVKSFFKWLFCCCFPGFRHRRNGYMRVPANDLDIQEGWQNIGEKHDFTGSTFVQLHEEFNPANSNTVVFQDVEDSEEESEEELRNTPLTEEDIARIKRLSEQGDSEAIDAEFIIGCPKVNEREKEIVTILSDHAKIQLEDITKSLNLAQGYAVKEFGATDKTTQDVQRINHHWPSVHRKVLNAKNCDGIGIEYLCEKVTQSSENKTLNSLINKAVSLYQKAAKIFSIAVVGRVKHRELIGNSHSTVHEYSPKPSLFGAVNKRTQALIDRMNGVYDSDSEEEKQKFTL